MLNTTINSYLYTQYADDDDLQAFVAAYNGMTQTYVDWFFGVALPFYPGLTGPLLDWVAKGMYDIPRTAVQSPAQGSIGPFNTQRTLNQFGFPYNGFSQGTPPTTFVLSDDLFQRVITWNFYKADGKRFCIRWLKRRIMRFILGTNGLDPLPTDPDFVIGTETTYPISISVVTGLLTVNISQSALSALVSNLAPNILSVFKLAFLGGVLDLPVDYTYAVSINA